MEDASVLHLKDDIKSEDIVVIHTIIMKIRLGCENQNFDFILNKFLKYPDFSDNQITYNYIRNLLRFYVYIDIRASLYVGEDATSIKKALLHSITLLSSLVTDTIQVVGHSYSLCYNFITDDDDSGVFMSLFNSLAECEEEVYRCRVRNVYTKILKENDGDVDLSILREFMIIASIAEIIEYPTDKPSITLRNIYHMIEVCISKINVTIIANKD